MFVSKCQVNFIDKVVGVTKDGERFVSVNVIPLNDTKKFNFISKDDEVINYFKTCEFKRFEEITVLIGFNREFNQEKRTSYWSANLVGVE